MVEAFGCAADFSFSLLGGALVGIAGNLFYSTAEPENCLDWRVRPSDAQYDSQKERWNDLRDHLLEDLAAQSSCRIGSWLQGSYKFGTQIRPAATGQEFDIDLGVYFHWSGTPDEGDHTPLDVKDFVQKSLEKYAADDGNDAEAVDEPHAKCSRIHFGDSFHIDVPAYHLDETRDARALATARDTWEDSDPKAIYRWWKDSLDEMKRPQCRRIVRYLKMWAALKFQDDARPSSILLTVLAAQAYLDIDPDELSGDDELLQAIVAKMVDRIERSMVVSNPANTKENLNRLAAADSRLFLDRLTQLQYIAERGLNAATKMEASEIWSEAFAHFFPVPSDKVLAEEAALRKNSDSMSWAGSEFTPSIAVKAVGGNGKTFTGTDRIGPIPKGCKITFTLANAAMLPPGAVLSWTVRNAGPEAEAENDLGHSAGHETSAIRDSEYRGTHFMDLSVKLNGALIGTKRVPVEITGLGIPPRNRPRPGYTVLRSRRRR